METSNKQPLLRGLSKEEELRPISGTLLSLFQRRPPHNQEKKSREFFEFLRPTPTDTNP